MLRRQRKASVAPPTDLGMNGQGSTCNARQCPSRQQPLKGRSHSIEKLSPRAWQGHDLLLPMWLDTAAWT